MERELGFSPFCSNASYCTLLPPFSLCVLPSVWMISTVYICVSLGSERLGNVSKVAQQMN